MGHALAQVLATLPLADFRHATVSGPSSPYDGMRNKLVQNHVANRGQRCSLRQAVVCIVTSHAVGPIQQHCVA